MKSRAPIAVVGMAGIFPDARDLKTFWHNIIHKTSAVCQIPENRWIDQAFSPYGPRSIPDKAYSTRACLVDDVEPGDVDLDRDLLSVLDPMHRLVLAVGKTLLECGAALPDKDRIGVSLAAIALPTWTANRLSAQILETAAEAQCFDKRLDAVFDHRLPQFTGGRVTGFPAVLLARAFDLRGFTHTLDAACASSLYSIKIACDALQSYQSDAVIAGGVSRPDNIFTQIGFSQLRALSPSGRCAPFDRTADGLVVGEGAGLLLLKRLDDAVRDKDHIYGLIKGIGLSNDMSGNLLAPDSEGQCRAMASAYAAAGWLPTDVDLVECHGAGTLVGDLVELQSLHQFWKTAGSTGKPVCTIGSVKSNVGHLLTAAGAAGAIKTLLALQHKILPPTANFSEPPKNSPIGADSPFQVRTEPATWSARKDGFPRRAAVSAFGFGGINGHLLIEEWIPEKRSACGYAVSEKQNGSPGVTGVQTAMGNKAADIAIVGMGTAFGEFDTLTEFQTHVFRGIPMIGKRPEHRWKGCENTLNVSTGFENLYGAFIPKVTIQESSFHIPPNEIFDMLPQQLLMLKTAAAALKDAGLPLRGKRPRMGTVIGIGFDYETTNFRWRWSLLQTLEKWNTTYSLGLTETDVATWAENLIDLYGPSLTATRTLGNLGSIVASRVAREFQLGGPSYTISSEEASGLSALRLAATALAQNEIDGAIVGAVDLNGDIRALLARQAVRPYSTSPHIAPFDIKADGTLPGEGAVAVVLKRLEDAVSENCRIYAVIKGMSHAGAGNSKKLSERPYSISLNRLFSGSDAGPESIGMIETHGSGQPLEDAVERKALQAFFSGHVSKDRKCAVTSVKPVIGQTGAASGLASVVKTALCLYHEMIPPLPGYEKPAGEWNPEAFYFPHFPEYWARNREEGPRSALVGTLTMDGNCEHALLEQMEYSNTGTASGQVQEQVDRERNRPLGWMEHGLFRVQGPDSSGLIKNLDHLIRFVAAAAPGSRGTEDLARKWFLANRESDDPRNLNLKSACIIAQNIDDLLKFADQAKERISKNRSSEIIGRNGVVYTAHPVGSTARIAFVYPGSGNHYTGMGRQLAVSWPGILRRMDAETLHLKRQLLPDIYVPRRIEWEKGWEKEAALNLTSDPTHMIFGQVVYGDLVTRLVNHFGIQPQAVIGYSLGQSVGYFASGAWPDRGEMLSRIEKSDLFKTKLAGPCLSAREAWRISPDEDVDWCVAVVNRPAEAVRAVMGAHESVRLLIVNTHEQCVIGGRKPQVMETIQTLGCEFIELDGVVTVHCDAAEPVAQEYRDLHLFPVNPPENIDFYSCAEGSRQDLTSESAADSILKQALYGFDFAQTIENAYADGIRIFVEMGPHASCTGMIRSILKNKPHVAASAGFRGEDEGLTLLKLLATLISEGIPVNLDQLYGDKAFPQELIEPDHSIGTPIVIPTGGQTADPEVFRKIFRTEKENKPAAVQKIRENKSEKTLPGKAGHPVFDLIRSIPEANQETARAHEQFLDFSIALQKNFARTVDLQSRIILALSGNPGAAQSISTHLSEPIESRHPQKSQPENPGRFIREPVAFTRSDCLEFAVGSVAKLFGPDFTIVDTYAKRVRLPDEPLMLVDRILSIEGEKGFLGSGRIVTEHDVLPRAWYLDGGKAPVCISVEAGQADLFLCAYMGIDLKVKGLRAYRLLDAVVEFHRSLPVPGETIRYEIDIDRFVRQGETYMFFFSFNGYIGRDHLITMTNGCAGFFTEEEVENSGGIILSEKDRAPMPGIRKTEVEDFIRFEKKSLCDAALQALRCGDLEAALGQDFKGIRLPQSLCLPGGPMKLIDRVLEISPNGGRYGLGLIRAEADIHPDDWFLTCHFKDDMVMPGTLMYECCSHTLRVLVQQMGWITDSPHACYEPVMGVKSLLKCRGPVTPGTRSVHYEVEIREIGFEPEPYVLGDAHMIADGHRIVLFQNISLKLSNVAGGDLHRFWTRHRSGNSPVEKPEPEVLFDRNKLLAFAVGLPSTAFGEAYKEFDQDRFIARLPNPPFLLMDRVIRCEPQPWIMKPGGWVETVFMVSERGWYFNADLSNQMPYAVLLEIVLQPCGWLAAYMGSALKSKKDLKFRNLDGKAVLHENVFRENTALTTHCRCIRVSQAGEMILQQYEFRVMDRDRKIFSGHTAFGFFTKEAMARQKGIPNIEARLDPVIHTPVQTVPHFIFPPLSPLTPDQAAAAEPGFDDSAGPSMPSKALRMIDEIDVYLPDGGASGLGFIRGIKTVDPDEWFFKAHFYQDPVCPGSLGIESFLQLLKFAAMQKWGEVFPNHHFEYLTGSEHQWTYRGQVIPENRQVEVEAVITEVRTEPYPMMKADGYLKVDGAYIYEMKNYGLCWKPDQKREP